MDKLSRVIGRQRSRSFWNAAFSFAAKLASEKFRLSSAYLRMDPASRLMDPSAEKIPYRSRAFWAL